MAGNSYRYNTLQIDGAVNNDLFGLAGSAGTPGGTAETQPISLDAIQEIQLVVSPYDVRQGGFSGGGINAITKSGTNDLHGTAFFFGRNQDWVGKGVSDTKISTLKDKQGGGSLGGPIVQNKVFFFGTAEWARKQRPTGFCVTGMRPDRSRQPALFDRYITDLKNLYGYTPGTDPDGEFPKETDSDKYFVRGDFNLPQEQPADDPQQLHQRRSTTSARVSTTAYRTPDAFYRYVSKVNSTVGQLNSQFGKGVNELRSPTRAVRDHRESPIGNPPFPQVTVQLAPGASPSYRAPSSSRRGTRSTRTSWSSTTPTPLLKGTPHVDHRHAQRVPEPQEPVHPRQLRHVHFSAASTTSRPAWRSSTTTASRRPAIRSSRAAFKVRQWGFYAGDQWRARSNMTRDLRRPRSTRRRSRPSRTPIRLSVANFGFATDVVPSHVEWSPRVGLQLRPEWQGHAADSWRRRPLHGPAGVRVDLESVRQHRHRLHAHRRVAQHRQPDAVHHRSAQPADDGDRRARRARSRTRST